MTLLPFLICILIAAVAGALLAFFGLERPLLAKQRALRDQLLDASRKACNLENAHEAAMQMLRRACEGYLSMRDSNVELHKERAELRSELHGVQQTLAQTLRERANLSAKLHDANMVLARTQDERERYAEACDVLKQRVTELTAHLEDSDAAHARIAEDLDAAIETRNQMEVRVHQLADQAQALQFDLEQARQQLEARKSGRKARK